MRPTPPPPSPKDTLPQDPRPPAVLPYHTHELVFQVLNAALRSALSSDHLTDAHQTVERSREFIFRMQDALQRLPQHKGLVFRAIPVQLDTDLYPLYDFVVWQAFSSATRSRDAARAFLKGHGMMQGQGWRQQR